MREYLERLDISISATTLRAHTKKGIHKIRRADKHTRREWQLHRIIRRNQSSPSIPVVKETTELAPPIKHKIKKMPPVPVALHVGKVHLLRSTINASRRYAARHLLSLPITNHVLICYHVISACIWQARFGTWLSGTRTINTPVDGGTWHQLTHSGTQSLTHVHTHSVPALWDYKYHRIKKRKSERQFSFIPERNLMWRDAGTGSTTQTSKEQRKIAPRRNATYVKAQDIRDNKGTYIPRTFHYCFSSA